jgi:hypothetical protein
MARVEKLHISTVRIASLCLPDAEGDTALGLHLLLLRAWRVRVVGRSHRRPSLRVAPIAKMTVSPPAYVSTTGTSILSVATRTGASSVSIWAVLFFAGKTPVILESQNGSPKGASPIPMSKRQ